MTEKGHFLVIGSGSIARRHIRNLKSLYPESTVCCASSSGREISAAECGADLILSSMQQAVAVSPVFAVIASPAPFHMQHAAELLDAGIPILIEKPISHTLESLQSIATTLQAHKSRISIGYNLRYLPSAIEVSRLIADPSKIGKIFSIHLEVGQYLPDWRPGTDYRNNVSAQRALGGGPLLELSHELDYLTWLFGRFDNVYCLMHQSDVLQMDVEDRVDAIFSRADGAVATLHLDFLQKSPSRHCKVICEHGNIYWDLLKNRVTFAAGSAGETVIYQDSEYDRNSMYINQLRDFYSVAQESASPMVDLDQAESVLQMIEAMRESARLRTPILLLNGC